MANRFFTHSSTLQGGSTARASAVNAQLDLVDAGFEDVQAEMNRTFRMTDGATPDEGDYQIPESPAQRAGRALGFDADGNPGLLSEFATWRGNWATATAYSINDVIAAPSANYYSLYVCVTAHTSSVFATDLAKWSLMVDLTKVQQSIITHKIITVSDSPYQAVAGDDLMVNVSSGAVTINLPLAPVITDQPINIMHIGGSLATYAITIGRNGKLIMGLAENMTVNTTNASFGLAYSNATYGWRIRGV